MKTFEYHSPKDIKEASKIATSRSVFLAGGMTTIPSMKFAKPNFIEGMVVIPPAKKAELEEANLEASLTSFGA